MATARIAPGRMEVETDLLLGMDDVLLPFGFVTPTAALRTEAHGVAHTGTSSERAQAVAPVRESLSRSTTQGSVAGVSSGTSSGTSRGFESELFDPRPKHGVGAAVRAVVEPKQSDDIAGPTRRQQSREVQSATPPVVGAQSDAPTPIQDIVRSDHAGTNAERLAALELAHATQCPHCTTATAHTRLVFGEGNPHAELVFVGEAPGETEDAQGRPFVGRAGEKLDEMIAAMGLRRSDVYIANVLKSRPPDNRTPLAHEVERCGPYLLAQLSIIRPKVIITLGGPATKLLLATDQGITRMRGVAGSVRLGVADGVPCDVPVLPTFHPAYLLRNYTIETRRQVWEDLKKALALLGREAPTRPTSTS